jgi:ketosteroid isomerase-like protein
MRFSGHVVALSLALIVCAAPLAAQTASARASRADAQAIHAVLDSTVAGWNRGDLSRYLWAYDDSLTALGATGMERGRATLEASMRAGFWKSGRPVQQLRYEHVDIRPLGANHALVTGRFVLTGANRPDRAGWFTTVWARTPAGWRMIHDHSG